MDFCNSEVWGLIEQPITYRNRVCFIKQLCMNYYCSLFYSIIPYLCHNNDEDWNVKLTESKPQKNKDWKANLCLRKKNQKIFSCLKAWKNHWIWECATSESWIKKESKPVMNVYTFVLVIFFYLLQVGKVISMDDMNTGLKNSRLLQINKQRVM